MAKSADAVTVKVPQDDGEILISIAGNDPTTYPVKAGQVAVPAKDAEQFLRLVPGAQRAEEA
jgi:uncharacterized membrane-anchored protein